MSDKKKTIDSIPEFLAHAIAMEDESAERYEMLADSMEVHHNHEVADLFRKLMGYSETHAAEVRERASGIELPDIPPWDYKWNCPDAPEGRDCFDGEIDYLMTPQQALKVAMHNEIGGRDFYASVASDSPDAEVREMAKEMAEEEQEHVELLQEWIDNAGFTDEPPLEDLDPPHMPE